MTRVHTIRRGDRMNLETATPTTETTTFAPNFLDHMYDGRTLDADEKLELTKIVCNAMTNQVMWSLLSHVNAQKRASEQGSHIDERNEQDEATRGQELSDHLTDASGFEVRIPPIKIAAICDGIRVHAYDQLHSLFEMDDAEKALYTDPKYPADDPKKYRTPMSLQGLLRFWADLRGEISPSDKARLDIVKSRFPEQHARALDDAKARARREAARFREAAASVMTEAGSFTEAYDFDAFTALPLNIQLAAAERIQSKLLDRAAKVLTNQQMDVNDAISASVAIQGLSDHARSWLNQPKIRAARDVLAAAKAQAQAGRKAPSTPVAPTEGGVAGMADDLPF